MRISVGDVRKGINWNAPHSGIAKDGPASRPWRVFVGGHVMPEGMRTGAIASHYGWWEEAETWERTIGYFKSEYRARIAWLVAREDYNQVECVLGLAWQYCLVSADFHWGRYPQYVRWFLSYLHMAQAAGVNRHAFRDLGRPPWLAHFPQYEAEARRLTPELFNV